MGRPRTEESQATTTDRVLLAAEDQFAEAGFDRARLADIARAAGIRRPSLLYHFPSKEALYTAVVHRIFGRLGEMLTTAMNAEGDFAARAVQVVRAYGDFLDAYPELAKVFLRELLDGRGPGRELLVTEIVPLLDALEAFVQREGAGVVPDRLPVRQAIVQVAMDMLVRAAAGPMREALWGREDHSTTLAKILFLKEPHR